MSIDELKEMLGDYDDEIVFLENPSYISAIIGIDTNNRLIYDYEKMAQHLVKEDKMELDEAYEFIDYNTIRALPYMGEKAPIIKMPFV